MTPFFTLPYTAHGFFSTWTVLISIGFVFCAVYAAYQLRVWSSVLSAVLFLLAYMTFSTLKMASEHMLVLDSNIVNNLLSLPHVFHAAFLILLSLACVVQCRAVYRYDKTHITPKSVKQAADDLTTGLLYYHDNGQIRMINHKMNDLSFVLFGHALLNGKTFEDELGGEKIITAKDGKKYRFTKRDFFFKGISLHEITAEDVTELYLKIDALRAENEQLCEHNRHMRDYGEKIDEMITREEKLNAKVYIHDEMNRLLLSIDNAIRRNDNKEKAALLNELQKNILILCMEADSETDNEYLADLYELSARIGITVHMKNQPKLSNEQMRIFVLAAEESMVNAVKHANAKQFYIESSATENFFSASFSNDGTVPTQPVHEVGGLHDLRHRIEAVGGQMSVSYQPQFTLKIILPKEEDAYVI
ncbi:MAG TPA: hypothetical protein DDY98_00215 [Ruminococcaceae bacterium]|nr:hypothetical protein [Oscillospiraceae bacterium]